MVKIKVYDLKGQKGKEIEKPKVLSGKIREDIVAKVIEAKKQIQPYAPSPVAGNQASASGKIKHHRHVWKSQYGRGMSRIPRKALSRKGSQFNWVGATVPNTRGGRRAHPPKVISMINTNKINKKELKIAIISALSATAEGKLISKRYARLNETKITNVPFIVDSKLTGLKAKQLIESIKQIIGKDLFAAIEKKRSVRAGIGKLRGRKYKSNAGLLIVVGKEEKLKSGSFEIVHSDKLSVVDLANGGLGRLTVYTENAINELGAKLK
ncbi:50S ribosomal protein L4 [Candidatus Pacearchaeota archaeon]|nr:50S ribosomal protein L4 [Candidatus Pacearchaeota archaeon]